MGSSSHIVEEVAVYLNSEDGLSKEDSHREVVSTLLSPPAASYDIHTISREPNWLDLPDHIMLLIADKLRRVVDIVRFSAVCLTWKSIATEIRIPRLPLLMLATDLNHDDQTRSFYSLALKTVSNSKVPVPHNRFCRGSSHGWLITVTNDFHVSLLNPFLSKEIHLPPLTSFERTVVRGKYRAGFDNIENYYPGYLEKAVLSADPESDPNYIVMAIYDGCGLLAFFKPGDKSWTTIDSQLVCMSDIIYCRDQFYAIDNQGAVSAIDLSHADPKVLKVATYLHGRAGSKVYLVESLGDLLLISRFIDSEADDENLTISSYITSGFNVLKLDPIERQWIQHDNLEGQILFLGDNSSLCLQASDFPECKANSIYFTDDDHLGYEQTEKYGIGPHDMGIFSFEDHSLQPYYPTDSKMLFPAPIWVVPPH